MSQILQWILNFKSLIQGWRPTHTTTTTPPPHPHTHPHAANVALNHVASLKIDTQRETSSGDWAEESRIRNQNLESGIGRSGPRPPGSNYAYATNENRKRRRLKKYRHECHGIGTKASVSAQRPKYWHKGQSIGAKARRPRYRHEGQRIGTQAKVEGSKFWGAAWARSRVVWSCGPVVRAEGFEISRHHKRPAKGFEVFGRCQTPRRLVVRSCGPVVRTKGFKISRCLPVTGLRSSYSLAPACPFLPDHNTALPVAPLVRSGTRWNAQERSGTPWNAKERVGTLRNAQERPGTPRSAQETLWCA